MNVIKSESDFESVYNPDDTMQSEEMSFFNNFKYEGDDYQNNSCDEILNQVILSSQKQKNMTQLFNSIRNSDKECSRTIEDSTQLDNILNEISDDNDSDEAKKYDKNSILNETFNYEDNQLDSKKYNTIFLEAIKQNKKEKIHKMMNPSFHKGLLDVTFKNEEGMNCMLMCCMVDNVDLLKKLVNDYNTNPSVINSLNKRVGLHYACMHNNPEILSFLLSKNTSLKNFQDLTECTPLYYAALNNSEKCVEILLNYDANIHLPNNQKLTPYEVTTNYHIQRLLEKKMASQQNQMTQNIPQYNRTQIQSSNRLAKNSRKDRVNQLIQKCKDHYYYLKEKGSINQNEQNQNQAQIQLSQTYKQPVLINGVLYGQQQLQRLQITRQKFCRFIQNVKKTIETQKEYNEKCKAYQERMQKMNDPIKLRRKVNIDDFTFYRQIGEGSFGEVYLVKINESAVKQTGKKSSSSGSNESSVIEKIKNDLNNRAKQTENKENSNQQIQSIADGRQTDIMIRDDNKEEADENKIDQNAAHIKRLQFLLNKNNDELDDPSQKFYALKIIRKEALKKKKLAQYIEFEKSVMQDIKHPFVAKLHLTFQNDTHLFLLMDFYQGGDLGRILEKDIEVDEFQVKVWAAQIVLALEELHKNDIIYRDLKPENVVLDAKGNLHLIDFGLAKKGVNAMTQSFCGTPIYLPPEIVGRSGHNKMVDWYSLGVIIYELLIGRPPYFSSDCKQLFNDIQTQPLRLPKSLPEESKNILIQLLKKNYKTRLGFERDAEEVKQHPWFAEIDWERVKQKRYQCLQPKLLNIPTNPMEFKLKQSEKNCQIELQHKWSYYNIDETPTPKQQAQDIQVL
ncbi:hypothetical protein ABPG74_014563 [Tetrahymena malaccensis]